SGRGTPRRPAAAPPGAKAGGRSAQAGRRPFRDGGRGGPPGRKWEGLVVPEGTGRSGTACRAGGSRSKRGRDPRRARAEPPRGRRQRVRRAPSPPVARTFFGGRFVGRRRRSGGGPARRRCPRPR